MKIDDRSSALATYEALNKEELIKLLLEKRPEGINLVFAGKANAKLLVKKVRPRALRAVADCSAGLEEFQSRNIVIEGDNLKGMVSLYKFHGQVDLIIADPPYNTGKDFRYSDKWAEDPNNTDNGEFVSAEDGSRLTKWMNYMLPRLQMMKTMLRPGGVIAICIDHRELFRLGVLMNEIFDEDNRIGILNWQRTYSPKNNVRTHMSNSTEYVLVYARGAENAKTGLLSRSEEMDAKYKNPDKDPDGPWRYSDLSGPGASTHKGQVYAIQSPFTLEMIYPPKGRCWAREKKAIRSALEGWHVKYQDHDLKDGCVAALVLAEPVKAPKAAKEKLKIGQWPEIVFGEDGQTNPSIKKHLSKVRQGVVPMTFWADEEYEAPFFLGSQSWQHDQSGHSQAAMNELDAIIGRGHDFLTVKPLKLFKKIIQLWCPPTGLILDPFAGSGTTGHAVLDLNQIPGVERRFILIEEGRAERQDRFARTLLAKRLKNVISGNWASGKQEPLAGGYRFLTLTKKVDAKAVLEMAREEIVDLLIASHWDRRSTARPRLMTRRGSGDSSLVAIDEVGRGYFLLWTGPNDQSVLNAIAHDAILREAKREKIEPPYQVYARFEDYQSDNVEFFRIPDQILAGLGFSEFSSASA